MYVHIYMHARIHTYIHRVLCEINMSVEKEQRAHTSCFALLFVLGTVQLSAIHVSSGLPDRMVLDDMNT